MKANNIHNVGLIARGVVNLNIGCIIDKEALFEEKDNEMKRSLCIKE